MKDIAQLLDQIVEQSGDKDASYIYGVECSSDTDDSWKALVRFSKADVTPVIMATRTKRQLKDMIRRYLKDNNQVKDINIRFHHAQIELEQKAIRFHEDLIKDYENASTPSELPTE